MLIVIVIIAILAGAMLVVLGSASDSAQATRIVGNLDTLRSAVLAYAHTESWNEGAFDSGGALDSGMIRAVSLSPYLDRGIASFEVIRSGQRMLVGFTDHPEIDDGVGQKLTQMAQDNNALRDANGSQYSGGQDVYMFLR